MEYEVAQDRTDASAWRAEAIDHENEGACYVVLFMGPNAEERARNYADHMNVPKVCKHCGDNDFVPADWVALEVMRMRRAARGEALE